MWETITEWFTASIIETKLYLNLAIAAGIFLLSLLARGLFTRYIFKIILTLTRKTKTEMDTNIMLAFENPLKALIGVIGLYLALTYLPLGDPVQKLMIDIFRSFLIVFFTWGLYNLTGTSTFRQLAVNFKVDLILVEFLIKISRFVMVALAASIIAEEWGYDVKGLLAGLGLGGLAFALAAKDAVSNVFGGIVIIMDKPFSVGDWILTPSVEGTVEEMSFRSTKVRTFANALVTVPNAVMSNEPVTNWTRMGKRRITFHLGVTYTTPREKLKRCVEQIKEMLETHPDIHKDTIFVRFDKFSESSLDIFLYFFTVTTQWSEYLRVKEEMNFKIMEILDQAGVAIAFPSRSLYFENSLQTGPPDAAKINN
jgi:MscS family membrane protein